MKDILQQLEATYGAPASLFERSAAAKAEASGSTTEAVLQEWAAEAGLSVGVTEAAAPVPAPVPQAAGREESGQLSAAGYQPEPSSVPSAVGRGDAGERSDDAGGQPPAAGDGGGQALEGAALLAAVADARGMPESLIERSASARARAAGVSLEDVLHEWAEEEGLEVASTEEAPSRRRPATSPEEGDRPQATADSPKAEPSSSSPSGGGVAAGDGGGQALEGATLLSAVAEARGMPESLTERSAKARAKNEGTTVDDVLAVWATEAGLSVGGTEAAIPVPPGEGRRDAEERSDDAGGQPTAGGTLTGAALLSAVAEARGMPESLTERSAKARAKKDDSTVEAVLQEWAADAGLSAAGSQSPAASSEEAPSRQLPAASPKAEPAIAEPSSSSPSGGGVAAGDGGGQADKISDDPADPVPVDAAEEPGPEPEQSARSRYPAWLAAAILVIPLLAVLYLVIVPNQPSCGSAGQLAIDPASGNAVGCDGSAYGANEVSNFAVGGEIYGTSCAVCHGTDGGGGAGPAMAGGVILETFPEGSCASHLEWVTLGSTGWPDSTYGENGTPVAGGMPGFGGQLTDLEVAQVSLYERVEFGGLDLPAAEAGCGFEPVAEEG
jgi:mono/diheme cytochrome c family protein